MCELTLYVISKVLVNGRLLVVKSGEVKSYTWTFNYVGGSVSLTLTLSKVNCIYIHRYTYDPAPQAVASRLWSGACAELFFNPPGDFDVPPG